MKLVVHNISYNWTQTPIQTGMDYRLIYIFKKFYFSAQQLHKMGTRVVKVVQELSFYFLHMTEVRCQGTSMYYVHTYTIFLYMNCICSVLFLSPSTFLKVQFPSFVLWSKQTQPGIERTLPSLNLLQSKLFYFSQGL